MSSLSWQKSRFMVPVKPTGICIGTCIVAKAEIDSFLQKNINSVFSSKYYCRNNY